MYKDDGNSGISKALMHCNYFSGRIYVEETLE